jgi:chemotaxis protein methyltransferase CheR
MEHKINDTEYKELLESIRFVYGYDFTDYAESTVKRRIMNFMTARNIESADKLARILLKDESIFEEFVLDMSVTVTEMFRDPSFYNCIREKIINRLATYPIIKIWIAGCATGEEVYSLTILLKEELLLHRSIIYATDINQRSLQMAKDGVYPLELMKKYNSNYHEAGGKFTLSDYYNLQHNTVKFDKALRENVVFSPHNLATDQSFNEFQMIICRNVLLYFNQHLQNKVIGLFHQSLCSFGFLGLGDKESLLFYDKRENLEDIVKKERIYRKIK